MCYLLDMKRLLLVGTLFYAGCSKEAAEKSAAPPPAAVAKPDARSGAAPAGGEGGVPGGVPGGGQGAAPAKVQGKQKVEEPSFVVEVLPPAEAAVEQPFTARVVLRPKGEYHLNDEFPTVLDVKPPAGVTVVKAKQTREDAAKWGPLEAVFEVKGTPAAAGEHRFEATFRFAVCTETTCDPKKTSLAWNVNVK